MSVPVNQRTHGKLEVAVKSRAVAVYTLQITKNKKVFTEEYQEAITDKIISTALNIHCLVWSANNTTVTSYEAMRERLSLQEKAVVQCNVLLSLIDIAKPLFHLTTKRVMFWGGMVVDARNLIRLWHDADRKRYAPKYKQGV